jgi:hypothetical protein
LLCRFVFDVCFTVLQEKKELLAAQAAAEAANAASASFVVGADGLDEEDRNYLAKYAAGMDTLGRDGKNSQYGCCRLIPIPEIKKAPKARPRTSLLTKTTGIADKVSFFSPFPTLFPSKLFA